MAEQRRTTNRVKYSPPPPELPVLGDIDPALVSYIGRTNYAAALEEKKFVFGIKRKDRERHIYVIGKGGVGKSKLFELLIRQDIAHGYGACLIDPHGQIVDALLDYIPEERISDTVLLDLSDTEHPISFNPLHQVPEGSRHHVTQDLIHIFQVQFDEQWSTQIEYILRLTILALLDYPSATMVGIRRMLTEDTYRQEVLEYVSDEMVYTFWEREFDEWNQQYYTEALLPIVNMLSQLLAVPYFKKMCNTVEGAVDFTTFVQEKSIVLINLARGEIGEEHARFIGLLCSAQLKRAGIERRNTVSNTAPLYIYIDECHRIFSTVLEDMLLESEKYRYSFTFAHQFIDQLSKKQFRSMLSSADTHIVFRVGTEDASRLKPELENLFSEKDMTNLAVREFYIKMLINGESPDPFSAETLSVLDPPYTSHRDQIINQSRVRYTVSE